MTADTISTTASPARILRVGVRRPNFVSGLDKEMIEVSDKLIE